MEEIILKELVKNRGVDSDGDWLINAEYSDLQVLAKNIEKAINYTRCCTELCDEERCSYTLNNDSKKCDDCGKVFN